MKKFYSASRKGFFSDHLHGRNLPADAVEITSDEYATLINGQSAGKRIVTGSDGRPVLKGPPTADLAAMVRSMRNRRLAKSDWTQLPDIPLTEDQRHSWVAYRAALRDVPQQDGFPESITWPQPPEGEE